MREIKFRAWHKKEKKLYFRAYQKLFYLLLCEDDDGANNGKGIPAVRADYDDCELMESTSLADINGKEIFEGDIIQIRIGEEFFQGVVEDIPDMFRSRKLHPLQSLLKKFCIGSDEKMEFEILGNRYEGAVNARN
jgi:uncharacterized phage protein (TIGR01671 family)